MLIWKRFSVRLSISDSTLTMKLTHRTSRMTFCTSLMKLLFLRNKKGFVNFAEHKRKLEKRVARLRKKARTVKRKKTKRYLSFSLSLIHTYHSPGVSV